MELNPIACAAVDATVEDWVSDDSPIEMDRYLSASEIANRFGLSAHNIRDWSRRHPDKVPKHKMGGKALFLVRDVLKYQAAKSAT